MEYYILYNGQTVGPMSAAQVLAYEVSENTKVSVDGSDWRPLYSYPELMELYGEKGAGGAMPSDDSRRVVCGILALVVGGLGLHYFLAGKTAGGVINILLALVTCGAWSLIDFIQGILILCMSDDEWQRKFVYSDKTFPIF